MKIYISLIVVALIFTACNSKYDGKYCKTEDGETVLLEYNVGDTYFIREVNISSIRKVNNFITSEGTLQ